MSWTTLQSQAMLRPSHRSSPPYFHVLDVDLSSYCASIIPGPYQPSQGPEDLQGCLLQVADQASFSAAPVIMTITSTAAAITAITLIITTTPTTIFAVTII